MTVALVTSHSTISSTWGNSVANTINTNLTQCTSGTRPTGTNGQFIYESDTKRSLVYDGTGWVILSEPLQTFNTFSVASVTGTITTVGTKAGYYKRSDGFCDFAFSAAITTNGTGATAISIGLPLNAGLGNWVGSGRGNVVSGKLLQVVAAVSTATVFNYDNTYPGATGETLTGSLRYQMTTRYS